MATMRREPFVDPSQYETLLERPETEKAGKGKKERMQGVQVEAALETMRNLPGQLTEQVKKNPGTALATVGAVSFVVGAFFGSRLGRLAMTAAIGYGVKTMIERGALDDIAKAVQGALVGKLQK